MGASSSISVIRGTAKKGGLAKKPDLHAIKRAAQVESRIEEFIQDIYLRSNNDEGLKSILNDTEAGGGREAFLSFLRTEYAEENLQFYIAIQEMNKKIDDPLAFAEDANELVSSYLARGSDSEINISDKLRRRIAAALAAQKKDEKGRASLVGEGKVEPMAADFEEVAEVPRELLVAFEDAQKETVTLLAVGAFPRFLRSDAFAQWRTSHARVAKDLIEVQRAHATVFGSGKSGGALSASPMSSSSAIVADSMKMFDRLMANTCWLEAMLESVELLPLCISLADASSSSYGFPLVYVNKAFEKTTGYDRKEIIGQNCRFLQSGPLQGDVAEPRSLYALSVGLREKKRVKVEITNFRKDGTPFRNLLAIKPIFDSNGGYAFILGMQFDIGADDACPLKLKMIDNLLNLLPDSIMAEELPNIERSLRRKASELGALRRSSSFMA